MPNGTRRIGFRAGDMLPELEARVDRGGSTGSVHEVAARDLRRYYHCLREELRSVLLTEAEASLICDCCNGTWWEAHTVPLLWANVADGVRLEALDQKWGVDGPALIAKLQGLTYGQTLALVDAVERFWRDPNPMGDALQRAGLVT